MTREGITDLRVIEDGFQNVGLSGNNEVEAENHTGRTRGAQNGSVEGLSLEQGQPLEQLWRDTPVKVEQQLRWGGSDWLQDSWNSLEAPEPSGWEDWLTETASSKENINSPSASSSGWGLQPGETEPAPYVDLGYFDQEILILGSNLVVRVAYTAKGVEDWIEQYSREDRLFGIDIEWRPNQFKGEDNKAALFQIAGKHGCMIVQLLYIDRIPDALKELLADPTVKLAGVGVKADSKKLFHDYGLKCRGEVDLGLLAADAFSRRDLKRAGLATLCELVLGIPFKKTKSLTVSNWAVEGLTLPQITYAASDACIAYSLLVNLHAKLKERLPARSPRSASPRVVSNTLVHQSTVVSGWSSPRPQDEDSVSDQTTN
ncbi:unnamed protein product [Calypogeia fissa]